MEFLHPCRRPPAAHEGGGAFGLARMRKARLDLLAQHLGHVDFERGLKAGEAPCLSGFMWRPCIRKGQRITCARPCRVERDSPDDPMVGMKSVRHVGIEREKNIRLRCPDLAHELLSQVEAFHRIAVVTGLVMTKLDGTARGGILVALAEKFKLPVHFIGVGEGVDDLAPFTARDFAQAIAGIES